MKAAFLIPTLTLVGAAQAQLAWHQATPINQGPGPRVAHAMAYDNARNVTLLFGGYGVSNSPDSTWAWDGAAWTLLASSGAPNRDSHALAFHELTASAITMGGRAVPGSTPLSNATWEWNGVAWSQVAAGPQARSSYGMAYDSLRGKVVLFGGANQNSLFRDTWEWDGAGWQLRSTSGPTARGGHAMAFDQQRGFTVLCGGGGRTVGSHAPETWLWNGASWLPTGSATPSLVAHSAGYHRLLGKVVVFGGEDASGAYPTSTWLWDGTTWQAFAIPGPTGRSSTAMAYDTARGSLVLFGGYTSVGVSDELWELTAGPPTTAAYVTFGQSCPSPSGPIALQAINGSRPLVGTTMQLSLTYLPISLFAFPFGAIGLSDQTFLGASLPASLDPIGSTGCTLHISIDHEIPLVNSGGTALWPISIPADPYFVGLNVFAQGAVLIPGVNPANFITSNAVRLSMGNQ